MRSLFLFTIVLMIACQDLSLNKYEEVNAVNCHPVEHAAGKTCIPHSFQRLITLDSVTFENSVALGIQPTGTVISSLAGHLSSYLLNVINIGRQGEPGLEKLLSLQPDLITGLDFHQVIVTTQAALTLNPSPKAGEGLQSCLVPLLPTWEKGLGDEGKPVA